MVSFLIIIYFKILSGVQRKRDLRLIGFNLIFFVKEFLLYLGHSM